MYSILYVVLTPKYHSVLYMDVRVVLESEWASSAASIGAELEAIVIPRPIKKREAIYMAAVHDARLSSVI